MAFPSGAGAGAGCTWSRQRAPGSTGRQPLYSRLHCGSTTLLSAVSLAPSPPHSSSPALLAAIAKPRAGIRIQLDARPVSMQTHNRLQEPHVAVNAVCGYFLVESRWAGCVWAEKGVGRWAGQACPGHSPAPPWLALGAPSHVRTQFLRFLRQMLNLNSIFLPRWAGSD